LVPPRGRSSSHEIRMPLRRHLLCASTPGSKLPSARRCNLSSTFRPRGFSPPRRFTPHTGPRACCIPQPARVRRVSEAAEPVPSDHGQGRERNGGGPPSPLPATRVHTLRRVFLVDSRCRITAVRCHLVVTGAHPIVTAAEAAARVGPGEPGAAGSKTRPKPNQRPAGMGRRLVYDEAPIRRERRTPTSPGHVDTGEPATSMRGPLPPTAPKRRLQRAVESRARRHACTAQRGRLHERCPRASFASRRATEAARPLPARPKSPR
jgi:hypothetical protein